MLIHANFDPKKIFGPYISKFISAAKMVRYLKEVVPPFVRDCLSDKPEEKRLLILSMGWYDAKTEAIYAKALEALGYEPCILSNYDPFVARIYKIFGIKKVYYYENYFKHLPLATFESEAQGYLKDFSEDSFLELKRNGVQIGRYAAATFMRFTRCDGFNIKNESSKAMLLKHLLNSIRAASAAEVIFNEIKPDLAMVIDRGYTPAGQFFDLCLQRGVSVIQRCSAHKSGSDILKRYSRPEMSSINHHSLSDDSWEKVKKIKWSDAKERALYQELESTYKSGDWFSECGTQFNKVFYSKDELITKLGLDPGKKTVAVFPHIFWDATFFWGKDLFRDYYDWFVNVLKIAATKENLNWIIKIHPANIVKAKRDHYRGEHKELLAVYETLGKIPEHIKIIPPETDINTFSLFNLMDYCLTVRGTVGIESAALGINTLTAGTGRYDRKGFTHDFKTRHDYLECLSSLESMPAMSKESIELAKKYAYGLFILRPIELDLLDHGFNQDKKASIRFIPLFKNRDEFENSSFVIGLRDFVALKDEDYLKKDKLCVEY